MSTCAKCGKVVYPMEEIKCMDKIWHRACFKCTICSAPLNLRNYKAYCRMPYCQAHLPQPKATPIKSTVEFRRVRETSKFQSDVKYHEDLQKLKGKSTQTADDTELVRAKRNTKLYSNCEYSGLLEKKAEMEQRRPKIPTKAPSPKTSDTNGAEKSAEVIYVNRNGVSSMESSAGMLSTNASVRTLRRSEAGEEPNSTSSSELLSPFSTIITSEDSTERLSAGGSEESSPTELTVSRFKWQASDPLKKVLESIKSDYSTPRPSRVCKTFERAVELAKICPTGGVSRLVTDIETFDDRKSLSRGRVAATIAKINEMSQSSVLRPQRSHSCKGGSEILRLTGGSSKQFYKLANASEQSLTEKSSGHSHGIYMSTASTHSKALFNNNSGGSLTTIFAYNSVVDPRCSDRRNNLRKNQAIAERQAMTSGIVASTVAQFSEIGKKSKIAQPSAQRLAVTSEMAHFLRRKPSKLNLRLFEATSAYKSSSPDEVSFEKGDIVYEVDAIDDVWMRGRVERTGMIGLLPFSHVEDVTTSIRLDC